MNKVERDIANLPDTTVSVKEKFGFESRMVVPAYSEADPHVPDIDPDYLFDEQTTLAILSGFAFNRGLYTLLVVNSALCRDFPVLALAAGTLAGMFANFFMSRRLVFR